MAGGLKAYGPDCVGPCAGTAGRLGVLEAERMEVEGAPAASSVGTDSPGCSFPVSLGHDSPPRVLGAADSSRTGGRGSGAVGSF